MEGIDSVKEQLKANTVDPSTRIYNQSTVSLCVNSPLEQPFPERDLRTQAILRHAACALVSQRGDKRLVELYVFARTLVAKEVGDGNRL